MNRIRWFQVAGSVVLFGVLPLGCASGPKVQSQAYAQLPDQRVFEYEFPQVWKAIEYTLRNHRIKERNPEEADPIQLKRLTKRTLVTDWIYAQSQELFHAFQVNGSPRKIYLQTRYRYEVAAESVLGGIRVKVEVDQEIQPLNDQGVPQDFKKMELKDKNRAADLVSQIGNSLLSVEP